MAAITLSQARVVSEPGLGTGRRRPLASGSPNSMVMYSRAVSLPSWPISLVGAARKWKWTPSFSASSTSMSLAGISERERR